MRIVIADKAVVLVAVRSFTSQAVEMVEANAVGIEITVERDPGFDDLEVTVQVSNDAVNWTAVGATAVISDMGALAFQRTGIGGRYVRVFCEAQGGLTNPIVFSGVIETTRL
jgi:hypothetical protein